MYTDSGMVGAIALTVVGPMRLGDFWFAVSLVPTIQNLLDPPMTGLNGTKQREYVPISHCNDIIQAILYDWNTVDKIFLA